MLVSRHHNDQRLVAKYVTAGISCDSIVRVAAWLRDFLKFVTRIDQAKGRLGPRASTFNSNDVALRFLATVAEENRGRTRTAAAARAIDFLRKVIGVTPLADDPRTALLKQGVLRLFPHRPRGAVPLPAFLVMAIVSAWGKSRVWWKRMVACIAFAAFVTLLRAAGILSVPAHGVTWVVHLAEFLDPDKAPRVHSGVLLLVPRRKSKQTQPTWIPMRAGPVTKLLRAHYNWRKRHAATNAFLFPSRKLKARGTTRSWVPNRRNAMAPSSLLRLLRRALREVCGMTVAQAKRFTLHSLRVGGMDYYRKSGVAIGMQAVIASHKSILTTRRYHRRLPIEQFYELNSIIGL